MCFTPPCLACFLSTFFKEARATCFIWGAQKSLLLWNQGPIILTHKIGSWQEKLHNYFLCLVLWYKLICTKFMLICILFELMHGCLYTNGCPLPNKSTHFLYAKRAAYSIVHILYLWNWLSPLKIKFCAYDYGQTAKLLHPPWNIELCYKQKTMEI